MALTSLQRRHLRQLAHNLKPVIIVGANGLTEGLIAELDTTLEHHELIKVRVNAEDREAREELVNELLARSASDLVQRIGHLAVIYRPAKKPVIKLP